ncbi:MAG: YDG domain-containing protein, partial [Methylococcaceae bacterium]
LVGDESVTATGSADFNSKDVLSANQVIVNSTTLIDGTGLGSNYSLGSGQTVAAHITPKALSASVTAPDKVYNGTTTATPTLTITGGLVGDETVTATGSADFNSKDVLSANQVTVNSTDLIDGSGLGSNYSLGTGQTVAAHITPRNLNVTATGINKVYDGTTTATVTLDDNRVLNDMLILSNTGANFIDENVATAKLINVSGINITGADAANYFFNTATTATADIIAAALPPDKPVINEPITINSPATTTVISNVLTTATQQSTSGGSGRATIGISATNAAGLNMGSATITVMSNGTLVVDNTVDNPTTTANTDNKAATATAQDSQTGSAQSSAPSTAPTGSPGSAATLAQPTSAGNATTPGVSASPVPVKSNNTVAANKTAASQQPATANQTAAAPSQAASSSVGESVSQKTVEAAKTTLSDGISSVKPGVNGVDTLKTALVEAAVAQGLPRQQAEQASSSFARVLVQNLAKGLPMSAAIKLAQGAFNSVTSLSPPSSPQAAAAGSLASSGSGTESSLAALSGTTSSSGSAAFEASLSAGLAKGKSLEQAVQSAKNAAQQIDAALAMDHSPMGSLVNGGAEGLANTPLSFQNSLSNALAKGVPLEQALQRAAAAGAMADEAAKADAHRPGSGLSSGNSAFMKTLPATGDFDKTLGVAMSRGISIEQAITNAMQINALQQQGIKADGKSSLAGFSNGRQPSDQGDKHFDTALTSAIAHGLAPADAITRARQAVKNLQTEVQTPSTSLASGKNIDTLLSSLGHSRTFDKVLGKALARGVPMDNAISLAKRAEAASAVHFQLPAQLASAIPKNSKIEVTTGTGAPLPSWLNYTPGTHKLIAYDIPQGALPMQVVMTVNGKPSTVEITETGVH